MAAEWMKLDVRFTRSRKVLLAGQDAAWLFLQVIALIRETRRDGWLPRAELAPEVVALNNAAFGWDPERGAAAVEQAAKAGLLEVDGDVIRVAGWCDDYRPTCSRCRKPNTEPEESSRCPKCRGDKGKADDDSTDQTPAQTCASARRPAQTCATGSRPAPRASARTEQSRAEQSRRDGREGGREEGFSLKQGESVPDTSAVPADSRPPPDPAAAERITATIHDISRRRAAT